MNESALKEVNVLSELNKKAEERKKEWKWRKDALFWKEWKEKEDEAATETAAAAGDRAGAEGKCKAEPKEGKSKSQSEVKPTSNDKDVKQGAKVNQEEVEELKSIRSAEFAALASMYKHPGAGVRKWDDANADLKLINDFMAEPEELSDWE